MRAGKPCGAWKYSIEPDMAELVIARTCVVYLLFPSFEYSELDERAGDVARFVQRFEPIATLIMLPDFGQFTIKKRRVEHLMHYYSQLLHFATLDHNASRSGSIFVGMRFPRIGGICGC